MLKFHGAEVPDNVAEFGDVPPHDARSPFSLFRYAAACGTARAVADMIRTNKPAVFAVYSHPSGGGSGDRLCVFGFVLVNDGQDDEGDECVRMLESADTFVGSHQIANVSSYLRLAKRDGHAIQEREVIAAAVAARIGAQWEQRPSTVTVYIPQA
jgi:hypothetical protein